MNTVSKTQGVVGGLRERGEQEATRGSGTNGPDELTLEKSISMDELGY